MSIREIAEFMPEQLTLYRSSVHSGFYETPIKAAQAIIGFEVAAHYMMGAFGKYEAINKFTAFHNQPIKQRKIV